jgi:hypothetical protein
LGLLGLIKNEFQREVAYDELFEELERRPICRLAAERRPLTVWKHLKGRRHIPEDVFQFEGQQTNRTSDRLQERRKIHDLRLRIGGDERKERESKLASTQMR